MSGQVAVPPEVRALLAAVRELHERCTPTTVMRLQVATELNHRTLVAALAWLQRRELATAPKRKLGRPRVGGTRRGPQIEWIKLEVNWAQADRLLAGGAS